MAGGSACIVSENVRRTVAEPLALAPEQFKRNSDNPGVELSF